MRKGMVDVATPDGVADFTLQINSLPAAGDFIL